MNIKIFDHSNPNNKYTWLTEYYVERALEKGGTMVIGDMTYTINAEKQEAMLTEVGEPTETCNYLRKCWGYEVHGYNLDRQWVWADTFEYAAKSRQIDQLQGVSCGPIVEGWK